MEQSRAAPADWDRVNSPSVIRFRLPSIYGSPVSGSYFVIYCAIRLRLLTVDRNGASWSQERFRIFSPLPCNYVKKRLICSRSNSFLLRKSMVPVHAGCARHEHREAASVEANCRSNTPQKPVAEWDTLWTTEKRGSLAEKPQALAQARLRDQALTFCGDRHSDCIYLDAAGFGSKSHMTCGSRFLTSRAYPVGMGSGRLRVLPNPMPTHLPSAVLSTSVGLLRG